MQCVWKHGWQRLEWRHVALTSGCTTTVRTHKQALGVMATSARGIRLPTTTTSSGIGGSGTRPAAGRGRGSTEAEGWQWSRW